MSDKIVETIYGKYHKFDIVKRVGPLGGITFSIRRDGESFKSGYSRLDDAVAALRKEG